MHRVGVLCAEVGAVAFQVGAAAIVGAVTAEGALFALAGVVNYLLNLLGDALLRWHYRRR